MTNLQSHILDKLCQMGGEDVARALTDYHGLDILSDGFYRHLVEDGYIDDDLALFSQGDDGDEY